MQSNPLTTTITHANGETNTCVLKEKINNENGQLVYRFHNQDSGDEYLLAQHGSEWRQLQGAILPDSIFKTLCDFGDRSQ